jgi:type II secretory pathway component PulF
MATKSNKSKKVDVATVDQVVAGGMSVEQLMAKHKTKSDAVRYLSGTGMTTGQIAKFMGMRYQHVRNILVTPLKKTEAVAVAD